MSAENKLCQITSSSNPSEQSLLPAWVKTLESSQTDPVFLTG